MVLSVSSWGSSRSARAHGGSSSTLRKGNTISELQKVPAVILPPTQLIFLGNPHYAHACYTLLTRIE